MASYWLTTLAAVAAAMGVVCPAQARSLWEELPIGMADTELQAMYPPTAKAIYSIGWAKIAPIFYTDDCPGIADIDLGSNGIIKRVRLVGAADTTGACYRAVQRKLLLELGEPKQKSPMTWFDGDTQIIFMRALTTNTMRSIEGSPMFDTWRITYQRKRRE